MLMMVTIVFMVLLVVLSLARLNNWILGEPQAVSVRWQALTYGLTVVGFAIWVFLQFSLQVDSLPTDTPAQSLWAMNLEHQRLVYSFVAAAFSCAGFAVYVLKFHRRAA